MSETLSAELPSCPGPSAPCTCAERKPRKIIFIDIILLSATLSPVPVAFVGGRIAAISFFHDHFEPVANPLGNNKRAFVKNLS